MKITNILSFIYRAWHREFKWVIPWCVGIISGLVLSPFYNSVLLLVGIAVSMTVTAFLEEAFDRLNGVDKEDGKQES